MTIPGQFDPLNVAEAARCHQLERVELTLQSLLPLHLQDGSDLESARAWFTEHGIHLEGSGLSVSVVFPGYLIPPDCLAAPVLR